MPKRQQPDRQRGTMIHQTVTAAAPAGHIGATATAASAGQIEDRF